MKKFLSAVVLAIVALSLTGTVEAQSWTTVHAAITSSANSRFIPTGGASNLEVLVYSASTSTSSVPVMVCATSAAATCVAMTTVSNVSSTPTFVNGPASSYLYVPATVSAGAVTVMYRTDSGPRLPGWKSFSQYAVATSTTGTIAVAAGKSAAISNSLTLAGTDSTTMTFPGTNATIARTDAANTFTGINVFSSTPRMPISVQAVDGAAAVTAGTVLATKAGVLAITLVQPTVTTHDGIVIRFFATTAQANTITTSAAGINGNKNTMTMGGAIGDQCALVAYQGVWYSLPGLNCTLGGS